jgi:REP element-mobilizing transposase RayT
MTYARKTLVSLNDTPYYHVVARCVRRAWLWGFDEYAGRDYSHRKKWVLERLAQLTSIFTIEVCAYAVMSNHYHLVVYVDQARSRQLSREQVVERWTQLFRAPPVVERWCNGKATQVERQLAEFIIDKWRTRLCDLSWLMKCLNEHLARRANAEDNCDGRFWQGRFRSQALLDEAGLLTAMAYVDLNPVRAGIAATPEESEFTSIYERIRGVVDLSSNAERKEEDDAVSQVALRQFHSAGEKGGTIPYRFEDYLALVDWTGRQIREDKRGHVDAHLPPIIQRLNIDHEAWCLAMRPRGNVFGRAMGKLNHLRLHASTLGQSWVKGVRTAERLYGARA